MKLLRLLTPFLLASIVMIFSIAGLQAATGTYQVNFRTVPDVTITSVSSMDLGTGIKVGAGSACTLNISDAGGTGYPGDTLMKLARGAGSEEAQDGAYRQLSGAGCVVGSGATGTHGLYRITGVPGGSVKITVNNVTAGTHFNFTATGCAGDYNNGSDGDDCAALTASGNTMIATVQLASAADTTGNSGTFSTPTAGETLLILGGTLTTTQVHAANTPMTESLTIDVTY